MHSVAMDQRWPRKQEINRKSAMSQKDDPCRCGSGRRYKKCCRPKDRARASGELTEPLASVESAIPGGRPDKFLEFIEPLTDGVRTPATLKKAIEAGEIFWGMALLKEPHDADILIGEMLEHMADDEETRQDFIALAHRMIERHKEMFPHMRREGQLVHHE